MAGYPTPSGDGLGPLIRELSEIKRRLSELEIPTGTSMNSLVAQVQQAIADIGNTINAWLLANSYTKAQIDNLVANPGNINPGNVNASGEVYAAGKVRGGNIWGNILSVDYRVVYVSNPTGELGHVPSSLRYKTCIMPAHLDLDAVLGLELKTFKYKQAIEAFGSIEAAPTELGLIAEEVDAAGLGYLVYRGEDGEADGVAYERLALPLLGLVQAQQGQIDALRTELDAVKAQLQ